MFPELLITTRVYHQDHLTLTTLYLGNEMGHFGSIDLESIAISIVSICYKYEKHFPKM